VWLDVFGFVRCCIVCVLSECDAYVSVFEVVDNFSYSGTTVSKDGPVLFLISSLSGFWRIFCCSVLLVCYDFVRVVVTLCYRFYCLPLCLLSFCC
jgi:hypothetical protein